MCGIATIIGSSNTVNPERLAGLAASLAHRGPDDEGVVTVPNGDSRMVGFVHRRLAIIDLSPAGHQPMQDSENGNWITFNGEIYNYQEIRSALENTGHRFQSHSDTEVILKAYATYGPLCLKRLRGMFAFALWDVAKKQLFCAVDRFGIKPLYYTSLPAGGFMCASEVRAILKSGLVPKTVSRDAVWSYLSFGAVQAPHTIIDGITALLPGHFLTFDPRNLTVTTTPYWSANTQGNDNHSIRDVLEDSVRHHLVSDVPVGLFLSGGIDSSAIAIMANRVCGGPALDSFSISFPEAHYSEARYARLIGEKFCKTHHEITLTATDLSAQLPRALMAMDQPTVDGINAYVVSIAVRNAGIKVVLSGQGGDEVFGGYPTFIRIPKMMRWHRLLRSVPPPLPKILAASIAHYAHGPAWTKFSEYVTSPGDVLSCYAISRQLFGTTMVQRITAGTRSLSFSHETLTRLRKEIEGVSLAKQISILEMRSYLGNMLVRDGDVMSMAHGLEVRVPFLDHVVWEKVMGTTDHHQRTQRFPKQLLIDTVIDDMPAEIYDRKKMGFVFPWEVWLRNDLQSSVEQTLHDTEAAACAGIDLAACRTIWHAFLRGERGISWARVWAFHTLLAWVRTNLL